MCQLIVSCAGQLVMRLFNKLHNLQLEKEDIEKRGRKEDREKHFKRNINASTGCLVSSNGDKMMQKHTTQDLAIEMTQCITLPSQSFDTDTCKVVLKCKYLQFIISNS